MKADGLYAEMWRTQLQEKEEEKTQPSEEDGS